MTMDFFLGQLRLALVAFLAYAGGKGWLTPTDSGLAMALITSLGPIIGPWLWSIYVNINSKIVPKDSVAVHVVDVNDANNPGLQRGVPVPVGSFIKLPEATKVVGVLLVAFVLSAFLANGSAQAQGLPKLKPLTGNIVNDIAAARSDPAAVTPSGSKIGDSGCKATGDPIADLHCVIKAGGAKLILHLKQSYALASAPGAASGSTTDNTSAMCTKALVPIVDLVVNGPKSGTIPAGDPMALTADEQALASNASELDGPIVVIEKIRILRLAIQSPALNDACGALVQDEVKNAQSLVGKVTSLITGAGILAPIGL